MQYEIYMKKCIELAKQAEGETSPNPLVGCVILDSNGQEIANGYHARYGENHAERDALLKINKGEGNTLIVNLEPCSHFGKTPPCADFIIEKGTKGFSVGEAEDKMGVRGSSTAALFFDNCAIPEENLLGSLGEGLKIAMSTLNGGRIGVAAQAVGLAQGALDAAINYVKNRIQLGKPISHHQNTQFVIADLQTKIDAARLMTYRAANMKDLGEDYGYMASMAKLFASEIAMEVTTKAVQLFGGNGYSKRFPVERMMRDAKVTEIYEGTSEVQKVVIASHMGIK